MRLIDAEKLIERINGTGYVEQIKSNLQFMVDMQPTIDAVERIEYEKMEDLCEQYRYERDVLEEKQRNRVEVVRCKDCKFSDSCEQVVDMYDGMEFHSNSIYHCSYGERRDESEDKECI